MGNKGTLSKFNPCHDEAEQKKNEQNTSESRVDLCDGEMKQNINELNISDSFIKGFDLRSFLIDYVLGGNFESGNEGITINISTNDDLLKIIVDYLKSKKYIGVGVGGVYITDIDSEPHVLLYKRYHEPENQMWSILGGSSKIHEKIENTLIRKINRITNISKDSIQVRDIIRANNHEEETFHYLSPAFYVDIKNPTTYLYWGNQKNKNGRKRKVEIIRNASDFNVLGESTYEKPLLAWVPVKMIDGHLIDSDGDQVFTFTTIQALESHRYIYGETMKVVKAAETVISVKSYQDWRVGSL